MIQTKQVFKYVYTETLLLYFLHLDELGPCVYIKLRNYVTGPWISWNLVYIFLIYIWIVYMLKWYLDKDRNL